MYQYQLASSSSGCRSTPVAPVAVVPATGRWTCLQYYISTSYQLVNLAHSNKQLKKIAKICNYYQYQLARSSSRELFLPQIVPAAPLPHQAVDPTSSSTNTRSRLLLLLASMTTTTTTTTTTYYKTTDTGGAPLLFLFKSC